VEDIRAETREGQRRWNENFSPLETGKQYFYQHLRSMGLMVETKTGMETQELRKGFHLEKINDKSKPVFESHCVDAWVLAASTTGTTCPTMRSLYYLVPLRWRRRQLHRLQPTKGGVRRREGGTVSLGLKKGTLVKHARYGICYVGGNMHNRLSLYSTETGKRLTQRAEKEDCRVLARTAWRTRFLHGLKPVASSS
jgi:hypothetical protein